MRRRGKGINYIEEDFLVGTSGEIRLTFIADELLTYRRGGAKLSVASVFFLGHQ